MLFLVNFFKGFVYICLSLGFGKEGGVGFSLFGGFCFNLRFIYISKNYKIK